MATYPSLFCVCVFLFIFILGLLFIKNSVVVLVRIEQKERTKPISDYDVLMVSKQRDLKESFSRHPNKPEIWFL